MIEEKWIRKFRANNPFLNDRMKKLEEQRRVESIIMNDLGYIVAYQHDFIRKISIDLVCLKKKILTYKSNGMSENSNLNDLNDQYKQIKKNQQFANTEDTIRLIKLSNQLRKALFQIVSFNVNADDDFSLLYKIHHLFDEMICYRNLKCTQYRNTFAPLPLFRISLPDTSDSTSPKCHGFSKILCRASPYIDFTYLPTKSSIQQIQKSIKNQNLHNSLKTLSNELSRTNKELLILKSDYQISDILVRDFSQFPPFDVVRESPTYIDFNNSKSYSINYVRSEISSLQKSMTDLISHIIPKLESSIDCISCFPQLELELNLDLKNNYYDTKHRLLLLQNIIKSTNVFQPTIPDYESIKYIHFDNQTFNKLNELKEKDYDSFSTFLESVFDDYSHYLSSIPKETENIEKKKAEILEEIKQKKAKRPPSMPEDMERRKTRLINSTQQLKDKISNDQVETAELLKDTISSFKDKIKDIQIKNPLFPLNFEDMLTEFFYMQPRIKWINQKFDFHRKENEDLRRNIENLKLNSADLKNEIEEKKRILNSLRAKNQSKKSDDKDDTNTSSSRKSSHCPKYICSICKSRQRNAIINTEKCGHTFCRKCLLILLRKKSQVCPYCKNKFTESDIRPFVL